MELKFLLTIEGHHGIPDGEWSCSEVLDSDDQAAVVASAKTLLAAAHKCSTGVEYQPDEVHVEFPAVTYDKTYVDVRFPGDNYAKTLRYSVVPVLAVGTRTFILTET